LTSHPQLTRVARLVVILGFAVLPACDNSPSAAPQPTSRVRFVNLISDPGKQPVDAFLDDRPFGRFMPFGASSPFWLPPPHTANYLPIDGGDHALVLTKSTDANVVVGVYDFTIEPAQDRSLYATGSGGFILRETVDDNTPPTPGSIRLRFVNLSETSGSLDLFITTQNADLTVATPVVTGVSMLASSAYFSTPPGSWHVRVVRSGVAAGARSANVVVSLTEQVWERGARTIVIADANVGPGISPRGVVLLDQ
jgi:hypothetical protein